MVSVELGYALSSEEHGPLQLVEHARRAEESGFPFALDLGSLPPVDRCAGAEPVRLGRARRRRARDGVARRRDRRHLPDDPRPSGDRRPGCRDGGRDAARDGSSSGVGTGENLNEHILGQRWPSAEIRREMLEEAVEVMRRLWKGT